MFNLLTLCLALTGSTFVGAAPVADPQFIDIDVSQFTVDPLLPVVPSTGGAKDDTKITQEDIESGLWPIVELPDANYSPYLYNIEANYMTYKNIRFGQSPVGSLRFAPPAPPPAITENRQTINGSYGPSCHQAIPQWMVTVLNSTGDFDVDKFLESELDSEDCLFLDVSTPLDYEEGDNLPVLVWIYGGGYAYGKKDLAAYRPAGFYQRANGDPFIYVAMNYRLGAFGWLGGTNFKTQGGMSNLGLHDQRLALKWVQDNIGKFGGDPNQVTVMGESAGAGSIVHHLTWQGNTPIAYTPFAKAITQSPAWVPVPGNTAGLAQQNSNYAVYLHELGCEDLACARLNATNSIYARDANRRHVNQASYGTFNYGPVAEGIGAGVIPDLPLSSFKAGAFNSSIKIFNGGVLGEGFPFVPIRREATFPPTADFQDHELKEYIQNALPLINDTKVLEILALYPKTPGYQDYLGISRQTERIADLAGQALVQCNSRLISTYYLNDTYNYLFSVVSNKYPNNILKLPLLHGGDVNYTFFDDDNAEVDTAIAHNWQKYLMGFVVQDNPNAYAPKVNMAKYGIAANIVELDLTSKAKLSTDRFKGNKCDVQWPTIWDALGDDAITIQ
ncbi:Carboxylesterase [Geopyxis carbonaria]|nr:Carboxylesterase [Geopyxis carbonaria]